MSPTTTVVIRTSDKQVARALTTDTPLKLKAQAGAQYVIENDKSVAPENITMRRDGADLQITLEGAPTPGLVIEGYYAQPQPPGLFGVAEDGQIYVYLRTDGKGGTSSVVSEAPVPLALGGDALGDGRPYLAASTIQDDSPSFFSGFSGLLIAGGLLTAAGAAIVHHNRQDDSDASSVQPKASATDAAQGINAAKLEASSPLAITSVDMPHGNTAALPEVHGTGAPGATVRVGVTDELGQHLLGQTEVQADGSWTLLVHSTLMSGSNTFVATESIAGQVIASSEQYALAVMPGTPNSPALMAMAAHEVSWVGLNLPGRHEATQDSSEMATKSIGSGVDLGVLMADGRDHAVDLSALPAGGYATHEPVLSSSTSGVLGSNSHLTTTGYAEPMDDRLHATIL